MLSTVNEVTINGYNHDYLSVQFLEISIVNQSCDAKTESAVNRSRAEANL